jgi:RNA polymerase sigma-70 factor (ECF subfamily)
VSEPLSDPDDVCDCLPYWAEVERLFVANRSAAASGAAAILRSHHDVEEVLQDAIIDAVKRYHTLRDPDAAHGWFKKIVARKALDRLRQRKRWALAGSFTEREELWQMAAPHLPPEEHAELKEALRFIGRLPEQQRRAYLLRHYLGLKLGEIAEVLGCGDKTVSSHLRKAQAKVDKKFGRIEPLVLPAALRGSRA